ncbi:MAG: hypothetical protein K9N62_09200 [Verrucomicrobia bacterium]|nr:hypothetical protein [Verrucomicrobiota bacterium]
MPIQLNGWKLELLWPNGAWKRTLERMGLGWGRLGARILGGGVALWSGVVFGAPAPDLVFLQETGRKVASSEPMVALAAFDGRIYAGSKTGLFTLDDDRLIPDPGLHEPVRRLVGTTDALWVMGSSGLQRLRVGVWTKISDEPVSDVTEHQGRTIVAHGRRLSEVSGDGLRALTAADAPFVIDRVVSHCETLYVEGAGRVTLVDGERVGGWNVYHWPSDDAWDWGTLPSRRVTDVLSQGSRMFLGTDRGLGVLRGMSLTVLRGEQGLPYEATTCLAPGFEKDLWIGTERGAIRMIGGSYHYFAGQRWLPNDRVNAIATLGNSVFLATDKGLGIVDYEPFTLLKKAAYYERHLEQWGQKRLGFTHKLEWDEGLKEFVREISDNDGGYSGNYLAAESYRFAVTQDPVARAEAVKTFQALRWLRRLSGIPGFSARSVWVKGERGHKAMHGSGEADAEWHDSEHAPFEWKGDTSSDEICSQFYSTVLFLKHVARGEEIAQAKEHLMSMAHHLIDHDWKLVDFDGKPTRWGRWDPEYFSTEEGLYDRGLQALELLSFVKTSAVVNADPKSIAAYERLVSLNYPGFVLRQRNTFPPGGILHFLDELALWSYANLLEFEDSPRLRSVYRRSLERSYEIIRIEQNPWFNFVYGALTGNDCEVEPAVRHLREWPLDLISWSYQNSHRADLQTPDGYVSYKAGTRTFSPRETGPMRWDHWAMQADGGSGGRDVVEPGAWLLAYWMGRFHGFIAAPDTTDTRALELKPERGAPRGARSYAGPQWPE